MWNDLFSCSCRLCAEGKLDPPRSFSQALCFSQYKSTREETLVWRQTRGWPDAYYCACVSTRLDVSSIGRASYCVKGVSYFFLNKTLSIKGFSLLSRLKIYSNCLSRLFNPFLSARYVEWFFCCYCWCFLPRLICCFFEKTTLLHQGTEKQWGD